MNQTNIPERYSKVIDCQKIQKLFDDNDNFSIKIERFFFMKIMPYVQQKIINYSSEDVPAGLFSKYTVYNVVTPSKDWKVKRRYSDFLWFRNHLVTAFPGLIVKF